MTKSKTQTIKENNIVKKQMMELFRFEITKEPISRSRLVSLGISIVFLMTREKKVYVVIMRILQLLKIISKMDSPMFYQPSFLNLKTDCLNFLG